MAMKSKNGIIILHVVGAAMGPIAGFTAPAAGQPQIPEGWEIVEIFPAGTEYYCGRPDINDRGQVVFERRLWPSLTEIEIMLYEAGTLKQLTDDDVYDAFPRINNHGHIVWARDLAGDGRNTGIVLQRDGTWEVVSDEPYGENTPDINDAGHIVWWAALDPTNNIDEIFFFDGTTTRRVTNDTFSDQSPRINRVGDFVFTQYDFRVDPWMSAVFGYFNRVLMRLTGNRPETQYPDINDHRQVVWHGALTGVELWNNGSTTTIVASNAAGAHVNNRGVICLGRWDAAHRENGLWLWRGGKLMQLTDGSFGGNFSALNDRGEIAFQYGRVPSYGIALFTKKCFRGDFDSDGDRDLQDYSILERDYGLENEDVEEGCWFGDTNEDGVIDADDFMTFVAYLSGPR
jgi:hypothetical protein